MAVLTAGSGTPIRESIGSMTLVMVDLTPTTSSDTFVLAANSPVVRFWCVSSGAIDSSLDVTYTASTGTFTITSTSQGLMTLFILMRN